MLELVRTSPRVSRNELYQKAFSRKLEAVNESGKGADLTDIMSLSFLGVKACSCLRNKGNDPYSLHADFSLMEALNTTMSTLTPRQFMTVFPIEKRYDGERWGYKDYFYTINALEEMGMDEPIGGDRVLDFLWDYQNHDINFYLVELMGVLSDIRRANGKPGLAEEFFSDMGVPFYQQQGRDIVGPIKVEKIGDEYIYDDSEATTIKLESHLKLV